MQTISLCMIVKNEEDQLENCLSSVYDLVDEIIIVDTGSTDRTREIARKYTDKVLDFAWVDDFSKARNFSFEQATKDYILWLDADDILLPEDRKKLKALKQNLDPSVDGVMMKYNTGFDASGNVTFSFYRERLVKRERGFRWVEPVHEYIASNGNIIETDICVTHAKKKHKGSSDRNLKIYERAIAEGRELSPRGLYYYARELKDHGRYEDAIHHYRLFLDSGKGWVEDNISACNDLALCYARVNQPELQQLALLRSFVYDTPRAEACCSLGYFYKSKGDYQRAVYWFKLAATAQKPKSWGFFKEDCWGYIPNIELAICYDKLGLFDLAAEHNELAGTFKPNDPSVEHNRRYFSSLKAKRPSR